MRRVLDPMFVYFDMRRQWLPQRGLAPTVLSDMSSFVENPGDLPPRFIFVFLNFNSILIHVNLFWLLSNTNFSELPIIFNSVIHSISNISPDFGSA